MRWTFGRGFSSGIVLSVLPGYTSIIGKAIRLPLRAIPHNFVVRVPRGPLKGLRWVTGSSVHGCWLGIYETNKVSRLIQDLHGTFYDIGANVGFYSLLAASKGCSVFSFEPVPENILAIKNHLRINQLEATIMPLALSDTDGEASFSVGENNSIGHLGEGSLSVTTAKLDSLGLQTPDVMKIDVEGAEYLLLQGAEQTLKKHSPAIYLATHSELLKRQCHGFLLDVGYSLEELSPNEVAAHSR
jgi:FkbM family methyltransferase